MAIPAASLPLKLATKKADLKPAEKPPQRVYKPAQRVETSKPSQSSGEKTVPHSEESEKAFLSAILANPKEIPEAKRSLPTHFLFSAPHRTLYQAAADIWDSGDGLDLVTFTQFLRDRKLLDNVGGPAFVTSLFISLDVGLGVAANLPYYIGIIREKFFLREMIRTGTNMVRAAYGATDDPSELINDFAAQIERIKHAAGGPNGSEKFEYANLMAFDSSHDPNCLVGNRYLVKGGSSLWAGGSGYGKSALALQFAVHWACGRKCFGGLRPVRPLKSLIIQAENDEGDMAEQLQGVLAGVAAAGEVDVQESKDLIEKNVGIHRVVGKSGLAFLSLLEVLIEIDRPDLVWIDPLFAFAGCDLTNAKETGRFVRDGLLAIAAKRMVALNVVHHARKPSNEGENQVADIDLQYFGFGSSDIQNAFRAVNVLIPVGQTNVFKLVLSKRGERAGAKDLGGHWTRSVFLRHSKEGICWLQSEEPDSGQVGRPQKFVLRDLLDEMSVIHAVKTTTLLKKLRDDRNMSRATFFRLFEAGKNEGSIAQSEDGWIKVSKP